MRHRTLLLLIACLLLFPFSVSAAAQAVPAVVTDEPIALPAPGPSLPGQVHPKQPLADVWRGVRQGVPGTVNNFPNSLRGRLIQSEGEVWRSLRNGWLIPGAGTALIGVLAALAAFYGWRGKTPIEGGPSGRLVLRFTSLERLGHWLTAGSFLLLALTGLIMLLGRSVLMPVIGKEAFSILARGGKWLHNLGGFVFIAGLVLIFLLWARDNLWDRYDWNWIRLGGGLLKPGSHPPAGKFNFGEKTQFWMVILIGGILSLSGLNLLFPLSFVDLFGMQVLQLIHGVAAVGMLMAIFGHIYIGTIGMEGTTTAVTTGYVDEAWAEQHHSVWLEETKAKEARPPAHGHPAE